MRWVWVRDLTGRRREEYFFTTDVGQSPQAIIETFTTLWSLEVAFQEMRSHLGLETTRGWCRTRCCVRLLGCLVYIRWWCCFIIVYRGVGGSSVGCSGVGSP